MEAILHVSLNTVRGVGEKLALLSNSFNVRQRNPDAQRKTILKIHAGYDFRPLTLEI